MRIFGQDTRRSRRLSQLPGLRRLGSFWFVYPGVKEDRPALGSACTLNVHLEGAFGDPYPRYQQFSQHVLYTPSAVLPSHRAAIPSLRSEPPCEGPLARTGSERILIQQGDWLRARHRRLRMTGECDTIAFEPALPNPVCRQARDLSWIDPKEVSKEPAIVPSKADQAASTPPSSDSLTSDTAR
jgi:hypothetical protein